MGCRLGRLASSDSLGFQKIEFERVQAVGLALLQRFDDTGSLGGAHGIDDERCRAVVDEVQQSLGRDVGVGNDGRRGIDDIHARFEECGGELADDVGVGHGGNHVARLVVDTQVQTVAHPLAALTQREVQPDGLALVPAHLAEGLAAERAHKFYFMSHQPQVVGDVACHAAAPQRHLSRHRVGRDKRRRQRCRDVHVHASNHSYISVHHDSK